MQQWVSLNPTWLTHGDGLSHKLSEHYMRSAIRNRGRYSSPLRCVSYFLSCISSSFGARPQLQFGYESLTHPHLMDGSLIAGSPLGLKISSASASSCLLAPVWQFYFLRCSRIEFSNKYVQCSLFQHTYRKILSIS